MEIAAGRITIAVHEGERLLLTYSNAEGTVSQTLEGPVFEIDGRNVPAVLRNIRLVGEPVTLGNGTLEYSVKGDYDDAPGLSLLVSIRIAGDSPVVRFRYTLGSKTHRKLTKAEGRDRLQYLAADFKGAPLTEIRFSEFNESVHSFCLSEVPVPDEYFDEGIPVMGPMLVVSDTNHSFMLAYEHGSQVPDAFIEFVPKRDRTVSLNAVKGNYYDGYPIGPGSNYESVWLQMAGVAGDMDELAKAYRSFVLERFSLNTESRKPYIFYNTWAYQERNKHWNGNRYLDSMTEERILAEIDVAHRMGIEVFVLDTGWYEKTGDWKVNTARFRDGLASVKAKLDGYGMKLGLWFNPTVAAVSSRMLRENEGSVMSQGGVKSGAWEVWETEASKSLCLASDYHLAFADELIRLVKEVGVTYFKWDAIGQYGCSDPAHHHGTSDNPERERFECYGFLIGTYMAKVVDKLCAACPEAIVDFDITEGHRAVGLGFLSAGKYFLINNGPYYGNLDIPFDGINGFSNVFVYPGPARARICRTPLGFDKWIPSVLFLTHYLPDDPGGSQRINIASLILGQNGIWGDLLSVSDEGIARFGELLHRYKLVRDDITAGSLKTFGSIGGSLEAREKISGSTGHGAVCLFSGAKGKFTYITENRVSPGIYCTEGLSVKLLESGKARIDAEFDGPDAGIVFFGISDGNWELPEPVR